MGEQTKEEMISQMRFAINTQMRYKHYKDVKFPFMQSIGLKDIWQGFKDDENNIFIGVYHLYWTPEEDKGIVVLNPTKPVAKGTWKHEWLSHEEAEIKQKKILEESLVDYEKLVEAHALYRAEIQAKNLAKKEEEMIENKDIVLN